MSNAYVYRMRELTTNKWYVGVHSGVNPEYICSSKIVLPLYKANPDNWDRKILHHGEVDAMWALEESILRKLDAIKNPNSYNANIGGKYFRTEVGSSGHKGKTHSDEVRKKIASSMIGNKNTPKGKKLTLEHRVKLSSSAKARKRIQIQTPDGTFPDAYQASLHYKVTVTSIRNWCKDKPGFSYIVDNS